MVAIVIHIFIQEKILKCNDRFLISSLVSFFHIDHFLFRKKMQKKFIGRMDDADTDSHSDEDFRVEEDLTKPIDEMDKLKNQQNDIELLKKR